MDFVGLLLLFIILLVFIYITYSVINAIYCAVYLDTAKVESTYIITRNGDGTISLKRRELFGIWKCVDLADTYPYGVYGLRESEENIARINKILDVEIERLNFSKKFKEDSERIISDQKKLPKIIRKYP